jgi:hypothetical protein
MTFLNNLVPKDKAYREAEKKIEEAWQSGATTLSFSKEWKTPDNEKLVELPESISKLTQLQMLNLSRNKLTELPEALRQLTKLQSLDISNNQLTELPEWIGRFTELQLLNIANNQLTSLPEWINQLLKLKYLFLTSNKLQRLPESIGQLTHLRDLEVENNVLYSLPISLAQLENLKTLKLGFNFLNHNPELAEAYKQGVETVKAYLRAKGETGQIILNEAKMILVGEGEVGKTCLMDALLDKPFQPHDSTHGIEIQSFNVTTDSQTTIILNAWDFGGQRVYRPIHQLFFSAPAVYLVVWKPREGSQAGQVKEWIQLVKRREPSAKILVVATHGGPQQRQPDIDRQELWDLFGKDTVVDFFFVESKPDAQGNRKGIDELKRAIAQVAASLPEVGRSVPKSFADVRQALQDKGAPYLPLHEVLDLCRAHNMDEEIARLFITISHRLGHLTHYENDPTLRDIVILRPDWLATAMSYVLDDEATRAAHGLVKFSRLAQLWDDKNRADDSRYPATLHPIFLRLMERFDLSYRVADLTSRSDSDPISLIGQLVPDIRPQNISDAWKSSPASGDLQQTQICHIVDASNGQSASAEGLFYQLIVRLHKYSLGRADYNASVHWQRGLVLDNDYNGRAFLEYKGNDVHITVRAPYPPTFLAIITEHVKDLVETFWEGLRCEIMVPCIAPCGKDKPGTNLFEVQKLLAFKRKGLKEFPCTNSGCEQLQNIDQLLSNAPAATQPISDDGLYDKFIKLENEIYSIRPALEKQHIETRTEIRVEIQQLFSQAENNLNIVLQALADEAKEGPRLFSLVPMEGSKFDPRNWATARFRLTLWCEHSHLPLSALNQDKKIGVYEFDLTREWVKKYSPLIKSFTITLKSFLPVAFAAAKLAIDATVYKDIEGELNFSKACIDALFSEGEGIGQLFLEGTSGDEPIGLQREKLVNAQNAALREFHALLNKVDPTRKYGNLVKVTNKQQKFLWVHEKFAGEY